jgi:uncharacterized membrane protein
MNPYFIAGAVIAVAFAGGAGYVKGSAHGKAEVKAEWDAERLRQQEEYNKALKEAIEKQQAIQAEADHIREETSVKIKEANDLAANLSNRLRDRKERPATNTGAVSSPTQSCSGASGAELARGDGEFLVRYAADAARLQAALDQCVKQYEAVRSGK